MIFSGPETGSTTNLRKVNPVNIITMPEVPRPYKTFPTFQLQVIIDGTEIEKARLAASWQQLQDERETLLQQLRAAGTDNIDILYNERFVLVREIQGRTYKEYKNTVREIRNLKREQKLRATIEEVLNGIERFRERINE